MFKKVIQEILFQRFTSMMNDHLSGTGTSQVTAKYTLATIQNEIIDIMASA